MDTKEFTKELARRKGISEMTAYRYVNLIMDTVRQVLAEGEEIKIGGFGKFTVVTELNGDRTVVFCSGKALRQAVSTGEGIV